jgi:hypothetical protein
MVGGNTMTEYKFKNATVRIHGTANLENIKAATECFVKKAITAKKKK